LQNPRKNRSIPPEPSTAVLNAVAGTGICVILDCAESVLEKWQIKVLFPELKNHLGKKL